MDKNDRSERIKRMNILLAVIVILLAGACAYLIYVQQSNKANEKAQAIRTQILQEKSRTDRDRKDRSFYENYRIKKLEYNRTVKQELESLADGDYDILFLGNSDACFKAEWVEYFFGKSILVPRYKTDTPEKIGNYLEAALSEGGVSEVFVEIDPYDLEQSYYTEHKYDTVSNPTYMQTLQRIFWNYASQYSDVTFRVLVPVRSIEIWKNYSMEEYARHHDIWDQFVKFSSRYSNIKMNCVATEEWIIANSEMFDDNGFLHEEYEKALFATQIGYANYTFDYNDFEKMWANLDDAVRNDSDKAYYRKDMSGSDVIFFGDSMFRKEDIEYQNVPGMFATLTNAKVYNMSIRGTTAAANGRGLSFCEVVKAFLDNAPANMTEPVGMAISQYYGAEHEGREQTFIILFGFNDYSCNVELGSKEDSEDVTYFGALNKGISLLKERYPNAHFVLASPIYTLLNDGGTKGFEKGGNPLTKYVSTMKSCSKKNGTCYINLFTESGITAKNAEKYLWDGVHPDPAGSYLVTRRLIEHFISDEKADTKTK